MRRSGSALLVVLGVLSFLVVSAVSFAAFMRRSRLPSSYLRRTVAARQLARAAVVRATDEIDKAIANGVHPGIGGNTANLWRDRVFFAGSTPNPDRSIRDTTPVLTMEGLAYIPPPLVNEARYWARKTPTSEWHAFGYDVGRYAYLAIDVSDYFDVNRLVANYPRSSAANRRVTISHVFEDVNHRSAPSGADKWDKGFMDQFRDFDEKTFELSFDSSSKIPLVSMADFNLALAAKGSVGPLKSPFKDYISQGYFYADNSGAALEKYGEMTFVTDGWFPRSETRTTSSGGSTSTMDLYDLADGRYQPFKMSDMEESNPLTLSQVAVEYKKYAPSAECMQWHNRLRGFGMAALADYLDEDRIPISLAVPTAERVPMICGVQPKLAQNPTFKVVKTEGKLTDIDGKSEPKTGEGVTTRQVQQIVSWNIDGQELANAFNGGEVKALVVYPFLHPRASDGKSWKVDGKMSLFLTADSEAPFRTGNSSDVLHLDQVNIPDANTTANGVINIKFDESSPNFGNLTEVTQPSDVMWESARSIRLDRGAKISRNLSQAGQELLKVAYQWTQTKTTDLMGKETWTPEFSTVFNDPSQATALLAETALPPLTVQGKVDERFKCGNDGEKKTLGDALKNGLNPTVYLNAAVWLRVKDGDDVVDMVPASILDDVIQNGVQDSNIKNSGSLTRDGPAWPLLKFKTSITFNFGIKGMQSLESGSTTFEIKTGGLMVADPRFNHAPENWFEYSQGDITKEAWVNSNIFGKEGRDEDIFMATSDAGYLQSVYELAFLPALGGLNGQQTGSAVSGNCALTTETTWNNGAYAQSAEATLNGASMWYTYDPFGDDAEAFENLPFTSEGTGIKVNPYSDSTNVLLAAFANTPTDWHCAMTNYDFDTTLKSYSKSAATFNANCAWNEYSKAGTVFAWEDLRKVAGKVIYETRANPGLGWAKVWRDRLDWINEENFLGITDMSGETVDFWSVDRKFFYGFWRDCFAAKQQLFLIFVRAEPLMLGGGTADEMPPQLGARAVALVWRDAEATDTSVAPKGNHRTRLLFYRPLE